MKTVFAFLLLLCMLAIPASAGVPALDSGNKTRTYGYVILNHDFGPSFGDGFLYVHVPSLGDTVRLDYLYADNSGAPDLLVNQWVAIDGYLDGDEGCLDGPSTEVRPLVIYRWTGSAWQIFDHDLAAWVPWP